MPKVQVETRVVDVVYALKGRYKRYGYPARFCLYYIDGLLIDTGPPRARRRSATGWYTSPWNKSP